MHDSPHKNGALDVILLLRLKRNTLNQSIWQVNRSLSFPTAMMRVTSTLSASLKHCLLLATLMMIEYIYIWVNLSWYSFVLGCYGCCDCICIHKHCTACVCVTNCTINFSFWNWLQSLYLCLVVACQSNGNEDEWKNTEGQITNMVARPNQERHIKKRMI
jgi:hypothetical protein